MNDDGEYVHVAGLTPDAHPDRPLLRHIESRRHGVEHRLPRIDDLPHPARVELRGRTDPLARHTVDRREGGAQHLVTVDDVDHRRADRRYVECTGDLQDDGNVVGRGVGVEPVDEPHALLRERHRDRVGTHGEGGHRPRGELVVGHLLDQFPDRRRGEHVADRHPDAQDHGDPRREPGRRQRIAADVEERIGNADPRQTEDLGERLGDEDLLGGLRRGETSCRGTEFGHGQGLAVELSVRGQRQGVDDQYGGGHHVRGYEIRGAFAHRTDVGFGAVGGDDVSDELLPDHRHVHDACRRGHHALGGEQPGLDLTEFDPEAAQLNLRIRTAKILDIPVSVVPRHAPGDVTGSIQPRSGRPVRVGDEPGGGEVGAGKVALRQLSTGHVHLAGHTHRYRPQPGIEDVNTQRGQRPTDQRSVTRRHRRTIELAETHVHSGFGDAVHVDQPGFIVSEQVEPAPHLLETQCLAAEYDVAHRPPPTRSTAPTHVDELIERRRRLIEYRHSFCHKQIHEHFRVAGQVPIDDDAAPAVEQRPPQLPHREVECVGMEHRPYVAGTEIEVGRRSIEQGEHVAVSHLDALRQPRRTRRIDHVGTRIRRHRNGNRIINGNPGGRDQVCDVGNDNAVARRLPERVGRRRRVGQHYTHT